MFQNKLLQCKKIKPLKQQLKNQFQMNLNNKMNNYQSVRMRNLSQLNQPLMRKPQQQILQWYL